MLRLPLGNVTVLLGSALARRRVMAQLDDRSGTCAAGHGEVGVSRLTARPADSVSERLDALDEVRRANASIVLVDRFTDGLTPQDRRAVLAGVRAITTAGRAVLVDDIDPVAALAVASGALRVDPAGGLVFEAIGDPNYLAS
jgi:hypothetical protein